ncbi:divergent PAP2 family protein [Spirochaeta dissipatitropha]
MPEAITAQIAGLMRNPVFLSTFSSWLTAQIIKTLIDIIRRRTDSTRDVVVTVLWKTGGMPSSHSSMVTSLALSMGFTYGFQSPYFLVSFFFGSLVIRDAMGVRLAAGRQAQVLNRLGNLLKDRDKIDFSPVKEVNGHTPAEVSVGCFIGFFMAIAFYLL